ncbi:lysophospholipid acyltransferase family protein [Leeuwenhoekiella marinoflava]|uniref:1-acyl-sn-glycerol-3-phosphate acyltransferase n=2 Tax=Leeuwenhoekiella marinoflava TaxID=988 RepID=A0A4Q0PBU2_9FLAO|nr:lysophospholipid acyltransferase family protein [Leeuwenhoekiella marinoflava]RXG24175.1 1-acyl-sn-glycerol-3-phosphate acyltransferase [Leeuwenhoekiella marinoflava]SHF93228.1 1-acyl-sn-glycerol-3-phosphate acyltransferase [Leeuwenhoekiella marinoflava DSM 3653]
MRKFFAYPLSVIFYLAFGLTIVAFHPVQWVCYNWFGYQAHKKSVDYLNFTIMRCLNLLGTRFTFNNPHKIKRDQPIIIVANHQGQWDISPIIWHMRRLHPKFISKIELGKGIPSISYNLRKGGSALIDRKDKRQSIMAIRDLTKTLNATKRSVVIFPEGTRSKNGVPKEFATGGLITLFKFMPDAIIVPVTIHNSWKLMRWGGFPQDIGVNVSHTVHEPITVAGKNPEELVGQVQDIVLADFSEIRTHKSRFNSL